ncbi:hypothetical protein [Catenibacterium mitsuokai]|uniref:hypothetical protein n=1 Tax=Catenibacterium mitsuokai TaxID=100886 RepID=UPI003D006ED5
MKKWTTPMAMEECFTANVDVAVSTCYKVVCDAEEANKYESQYTFGFLLNHNYVNCTYPEKNEIQIDQQTHKITGMIGHYVGGKVQCQFTTSGYQAINPGDLEVGKRVYWTSPGPFDSKLHHQGNLELTDPNKKCMS